MLFKRSLPTPRKVLAATCERASGFASPGPVHPFDCCSCHIAHDATRPSQPRLGPSHFRSSQTAHTPIMIYDKVCMHASCMLAASPSGCKEWEQPCRLNDFDLRPSSTVVRADCLIARPPTATAPTRDVRCAMAQVVASSPASSDRPSELDARRLLTCRRITKVLKSEPFEYIVYQLLTQLATSYSRN